MGRFAQRDLNGGQICAGAMLAAGAAAAVSIALSSEIDIFFGCCFVLISVSGALAASVRSMYAPGVLPPLVLVTLLFAVSVIAPEAIDAPGLAETASATQRTIAGIVQQATALVFGHVLALAVIAYRIANSDDPRARL